jgi:mono/diheme cytochrome c family protein
VALNWLLGSDPSRPNREFLPEMARSVPGDAYAPNPNFPDGRTLQPPQPGTIARGQMPLHYRATPEDAKRAGEELRNPLPDDERHRQRGAFLYANLCQVCHGSAGRGDGPVTARGPQSKALGKDLLAASALQMKDGQLFHVLTYGQGNMAPYAAHLARQDRWSVTLHVRSLQQKAAQGGKP